MNIHRWLGKITQLVFFETNMIINDYSTIFHGGILKYEWLISTNDFYIIYDTSS